jgi:hypothetical protein
VPDLFAGFAEGKGLAKASAVELMLEFVRFRRGWFGAKVHIRLKRMKWLAEMPGCDHGEVTLHVARRDRDRAAAFVQLLGEVG